MLNGLLPDSFFLYNQLHHINCFSYLIHFSKFDYVSYDFVCADLDLVSFLIDKHETKRGGIVFECAFYKVLETLDCMVDVQQPEDVYLVVVFDLEH